MCTSVCSLSPLDHPITGTRSIVLPCACRIDTSLWTSATGRDCHRLDKFKQSVYYVSFASVWNCIAVAASVGECMSTSATQPV